MFGCLSSAHNISECSAPVCTYCDNNKKHHRLLCFKYADDRKNNATCGLLTDERESIAQNESVLLGTALILVQTANCEFLPARALCDTGSQTNAISEECVHRLQLQRTSNNLMVSPVGGGDKVPTRSTVRLVIMPGNGYETFDFNGS